MGVWVCVPGEAAKVDASRGPTEYFDQREPELRNTIDDIIFSMTEFLVNFSKK